MSNYISSSLLGMVAMSIGLFFTNKYSMMISPRIGMLISQSVTVLIIYLWIRVVGDKFAPTLSTGWTGIGYTLLAGIFIAVGLLGLVEAFSRGGHGSVVIPIWGSFIVWSSILTIIFIGGSMTVIKGIGIAAVVVGIILVAL